MYLNSTARLARPLLALMLTLRCTPEAFLLLEGAPGSSMEKALSSAWQQSAAHGLIVLATDTSEIDTALDWLRQWGRPFFARVCQTRQLDALAAPDEAECTAFAQSAPPFAGAEYVSAASLASLWNELANVVRSEARDDLEGWLRKHGDVWHLVGRVTFHLAENKRDAERPFAFLATFTEKVSATGQLQHLPLARAVQMFGAQQDQAALQSLLEPVRAAAAKCRWVSDMLESRQLFQALKWTPAEAYSFVRDIAVLQDAGIVVKVPDWWNGGRPSRATVTVTIDADQPSSVGLGALLSFSLTLSMNGEPLTADEIAKIKSSTSGLVTLRGQWVEIQREKLDQVLAHWQRVQRLHADGQLSFHQGMRFLSGFTGGATIDLSAGLTETDTAEWSQVIAGKNLTTMLQQMRSPAHVQPPPDLQATLRPYQQQGLAWLLFMARLGFGACLADDMGLGKTIQVIATLLTIKSGRASMIVAPASLIGNWRNELAKFAPTLRVFVAHRSAASSDDFHALDAHPDAVLRSVDVVVTTYALLARSAALMQHRWHLVVLDEAQAIKNPGTQQAKTVKELQAHARIALTGTPVENRPGDLWSLFDFLNPGLLGSATQFAETLKRLGTNYAPLRNLVQPWLLRRMKTDRRIISDLPDKIEVKAHCPLTRKQATIYTRLVEELKRSLADPKLQPFERNGLALGFLLKFKQVCNHPSHWSGDGQFKPEDSGKFMRLAEIADELAQRQERAIVFTQFAEMCDPLALHLAHVFGRPGLVLHGGTPVSQRAKLVERFQAVDGPPFFVISVKAGGTGLTLTAANHVIHFDRWWNPAIESQATDRAFRIGQRKNVLVHKFVVPGTIEDRIDRLIDEKQSLAGELLAGELLAGEGGTEKMLTQMSAEELLRMVALDVNAVV